MTALSAPPATMEWGSAPELIGPRHRYRVRRLAHSLSQSLPRGHVLDAGCGAGTLSLLLCRRGYRVTAVDDSPAFVDHVRRRAAEAGVSDRIQIEVMDLQNLTFDDSRFDGVVCGEVLEHLPDDRQAASGLARVLRTGGVLALTVPAGATSYDWVDAWAGHQRRYEESELDDLLKSAGLRVEQLVRWGYPVMAWYEHHVQKPGFARVARSGGEQSTMARLARSPLVTTALGYAFAVDRLFEGSSHGTGLIARARKP
jgi:SAM-dependent methyltransferase